MKVTVEILRWDSGGGRPKVLHSLTHDTHSLELIAAAVQGVIDTEGMRQRADGYRLTTDNGLELYGWPDRRQ